MSRARLPTAAATLAGRSAIDIGKLIRYSRGLWLPTILLVSWVTVVRAGWVDRQFLPPPSELLSTLADLGSGGALLGPIGISTLRVLIGFAIGSTLAMLAGAAVGLSQRAEALFDPTLQALRAIPSLAWVSLLLLWLGVDEAPKIALIAIGAFFPVYVNLVAGIHHVDRKLVEVGGIYGLTGFGLISRIFLPAALPRLFAGLRSGLSLSWLFLVAGELIAAGPGLGYLLTDGRETGRADRVIVAIIVLAVLGKTSDGLLSWLERRLLGWRDVADSRQS